MRLNLVNTMRLEVVVTCLTLFLVEGVAFSIGRHVSPAGREAFSSSPPSYLPPSVRSTRLSVSDGFQSVWDNRKESMEPDNVDDLFWISSHSSSSSSTFPFPQGRSSTSSKVFPTSKWRFSAVKESAQKNVPIMNVIFNMAARLKHTNKWRHLVASAEKRNNYNCDFSRVTIQMIVEFLKTRKICGYKVNQVRFGLGGK